MDNKSFEKLDHDLMKGLQGLREKSVPQEIRKNFKRSVEERILGLGRPAGFSFSVLLVPSLVLVVGLGLCWFYLRPRHVQPLMIQQAEPKPMAVEVPVQAPVKPVVVPVMKAVETIKAEPALPPVNENELVDEIEALKEMGVWTEDDEKDIGISTDQIFEELETLAGEFLQNAAGGALPQTG